MKRRNRRKKEEKHIWHYFPDYVVVYLNHFRKSTERLLELIREFNNISGYSFSIPNSVPSHHQQSTGENKFLKLSLMITIKTMRNLAINITKDMQISWKNMKLPKNIKEDIKVERCAIFMNESMTIVEIQILPKLTYKFNVIPVKISILFLMELDKIILKLL